jgi:mannose-6-phosphate isomerase
MSAAQHSLQPIQLEATLHETIWGGQNLASIAGKRLPRGAQVGESWETEVGNHAVNPPYAGQTLGQLVDALGEDLVGRRSLEVFGPRFPLLAKFIDAQDKLSVQVHPDDAYARAHEGGKLGKTEAWYILHAEPEAQLVYGVARPTTREEVRQAIADVRLESLLYYFTVRAGDVVYVPAGTVHAIGAGIVLYELQEYSDITYRLYDYGRLQANGQPRELHVERSLDVMRYEPASRDTVRPIAMPQETFGAHGRVLVAGPYFVLAEVTLAGEISGATSPSSCEILSVLAGACEIVTPDGPPIRLGLGDTAVLPAHLGAYRLRSGAEGARFLRSYVPTTDDTLLRLWQAGQATPQ